MSGREFDASHRMTPLQRSSTPQDVARAVRFLLESPAITGTTLLVDGGQHLQAQSRATSCGVLLRCSGVIRCEAPNSSPLISPDSSVTPGATPHTRRRGAKAWASSVLAASSAALLRL